MHVIDVYLFTCTYMDICVLGTSTYLVFSMYAKCASALCILRVYVCYRHECAHVDVSLIEYAYPQPSLLRQIHCAGVAVTLSGLPSGHEKKKKKRDGSKWIRCDWKASSA